MEQPYVKTSEVTSTASLPKFQSAVALKCPGTDISPRFDKLTNG